MITWTIVKLNNQIERALKISDSKLLSLCWDCAENGCNNAGYTAITK